MLKLFLKWAHQLSSGPFPSGAWHIHIKNKSTSRTIRADVWMRGTEHGLRYREVLRNKRIPNDQLSFRFSFEGPNDLTPLSQDRTISTPGWAKYVITVEILQSSFYRQAWRSGDQLFVRAGNSGHA